MKPIILTLLLLGLLASQAESKIKHECQHHALDHDIIHEEDDENHRRMLYSSSWSPLRVTFDYSELDKLPSNKRALKPVL